MRRVLVASVVALAFSTLGACAYGPSNGNDDKPNPAPTQQAPTGDSDCGYSWKPCPTAPVASADAAPPGPTAPASGNGGGFDCQLDIDPEGTGLTVGAGIILATGYTYCSKWPPPTKFVLEMAIQRQNPDTGNWYDWPPPHYRNTVIPPLLPAKIRHTDYAPCRAANYRLWAQVSGSDGPFKWGPYVRTANVITVTEAQCKGPVTRR